MAERWTRTALLLCVLIGAAPAPAAADWYFTPFIGWSFRGTTTAIDLDYRGENRRKIALGGSVARIGQGLFGVEVDYALVPRFFQDPNLPEGSLVTRSRVQTLTGSVIVTTPLSLTRESLRPYLLTGIGLMSVHSEDLRQVWIYDESLIGFNVGAGALGMLSDRAGLRFDIRRFTNLDRSTPTGLSVGHARLSFWRATVGVTLHY